MKKYVISVSLKVISITTGCGLVAALIWYFLSAKTTAPYSSVLFWCGITVIALGALIFGGHTDISLAPRDYGTAKAIDPKDLAYGKDLQHLSESALIIMVLSGCLAIAVSLLLTSFG